MAVYACQKMCQACDFVGDSIESCMAGLEQCCRAVCPSDKPLPIFLTFALGANVVPGVLAVVYAADGDSGCTSPLQAYLMVWAVCAVINVVFAAYLYHRTAHPPPGMEENSILDRSWHLFLYDPGVYCYIFVYIFEFVFNCIGSSWVSGATCHGTSIRRMAGAAVLIMWVWLFGGLGVVALSLCFQCSRDDDVMAERRRRVREQRSTASARSVARTRGTGGRSTPPRTATPPLDATASLRAPVPGRYTPVAASSPSPLRLRDDADDDDADLREAIRRSQADAPAATAAPPPAYTPVAAAAPPRPAGYRQATYG